MEWQLVTEGNPAPKTGRMFLACFFLGEDYLSKEYPIFWDKRKEKWINWPERAPEPMLMLLYPNPDTYKGVLK